MLLINAISFFIFLVLAVFFRRSIASYLAFIVSLSYMGALFNNYTIQLTEEKILIHFTSIIILIFIIYPFSRYKVRAMNLGYKEAKTKTASNAIIRLSIGGFIINLLILSFSMLQYLKLGVSIEAYKNGSVGLEALSFIPSYFLQISLALTPLAYFALGYHFLYMINFNKRKIVISLIASFNIAMPSLFLFGRGGIIVYILIYIGMLYYIYPVIHEKIKTALRGKLLINLSLLAISFLIISGNRFSGYNVPSASLIKNPLVYSFLDYYSQWIPNSIEAISQYTSEKSTNYSTVNYIPSKLAGFFVETSSLPTLKEIRAESLGEQSTLFNGLTTILIYDFGYIGTLIFIFIYGSLVLTISPRREKPNSLNIITAPILIALPALFFQGSILVFADYNIAVIYLIAIFIFFKIRFRSE